MKKKSALPIPQPQVFLEDDKMHDECGVLSLCVPDREVARLGFFGLHALQHRGQESAGIATSDGEAAFVHKKMGLVPLVFNEENLRPLKGQLLTSGGRVLAVSGVGDDLNMAVARAYAGVEQIQFEGAHYRRDIGRPLSTRGTDE